MDCSALPHRYRKAFDVIRYLGYTTNKRAQAAIGFVGQVFLLLLALSLFVHSSAQATVDRVTALPGTVNTGPNGGTVKLNWRVERTAPTAFATTTNSPVVEIRINGSVIATFSNNLTRTTTNPFGTKETLNFSETITISASQARTIASTPGGATVTRTFTDLGPPESATGQANLAVSGAAGILSIRRIELSFDNGGKTRVVEENDTLRAIAEVSFGANGTLKAEWRLIDNINIRGAGSEKRLAVVRIPLRSSGQGQTRIVSPPLPTRTQGLQQIRLVILDPDIGSEFPTLKYYVNPPSIDGQAPRTAIRNVEVNSPLQGTPLTPATVFSWLSVSGAVAYQVEIFTNEGGQIGFNNNPSDLLVSPIDTNLKLVTGKVVPEGMIKVNLAEFNLRHLLHNQSYKWRIRAIGQGGTVIARSGLNDIIYP